MKKSLSSLNIVFLLLTIFSSYLSNSKLLNGSNMASVSREYHNLFTPAGYAFSIWGLIYLSLLAFVIYYGPFGKQKEKKEKLVANVGFWFILSCVSNSLWVFLWIYEYIFATVILMIILFFSLMKILDIIEKENTKEMQTKLFLKFPFSIYAGWISVALIADVAAYLTQINWDGFGISPVLWTLFVSIIAAIIHLFMLWKKHLPAFTIVSVWAFIAIAVANKEFNSMIYFIALTVAVFIFLNVLIYFFIKQRTVNA